MYSMILMTARAGAPQTPEFNGFFRDLFSFRGGCHGSGSGSCTGSRASSGCTGSRSASTNCSGDRPARAYAGGSCYGSCTGHVSMGSGGSSCCGGQPPAMSYVPPADPCGSCNPCGSFDSGSMPAPAAPRVVPDQGGDYAKPRSTPPSSLNNISEQRYRPDLVAEPGSGRATVTVRLPADATLIAEGRRLNLTGGTRVFVSPPLPGTGDYTYTFRTEYARNGETVTRSKAVSVRAGGQVAVDFEEAVATAPPGPQPMPAALPTAATAAAAPTVPAPPSAAGRPTTPERARLTVKLSPGATLYVDGRRNDRTDTLRDFTTPPLTPGGEYAYVMRAEIRRNGHPESQTVKVTFRAGEIQTVDLSQWPDTQRASR